MDAKGIEKLLAQDFSAGTERFRDELLTRCLETMRADAGEDAAELDDASLDMLAAAGDAFPLATEWPFGDNKGPET